MTISPLAFSSLSVLFSRCLSTVAFVCCYRPTDFTVSGVRLFVSVFSEYLTSTFMSLFHKIVVHGTPYMAADKEAVGLLRAHNVIPSDLYPALTNRA